MASRAKEMTSRDDAMASQGKETASDDKEMETEDKETVSNDEEIISDAKTIETHILKMNILHKNIISGTRKH